MKKCKAKKLLKKTVSHLKEDIKGYKENIKEGKKENLHEIKEDKDLIKAIKKSKGKKYGK